MANRLAPGLDKVGLIDQLPVSPPQHRPWGDVITIALFLSTISGWLVLTILNAVLYQPAYSLQEKRRLAAIPHLHLSKASLTAFPKGFESYLNDRFAFRQELVKGASLVKYVFGVSNSKEVIIGRSNWLYYSDDCDYPTLRHTPLFTDEELGQWARVLEARRIWLAEHGIKFLVVIAPSKFTVYPEFVPKAYTALNKSSRREQLEKVIKDKTKVICLDLLDTMLQNKSKAQLYYKTDSHWNMIGGFIASNKILATMKRWLPSVEETSLASFRQESHHFVNGDLANMLGLSGLLTEEETVLALHARWRFSSHPAPDQNERLDEFPFAQEVDDPKLPKVVFLRDSFCSMLKLFLGDHFRRAAYYWTADFPNETILLEKPDIVVEELVERKLVGQMPTNPPEVNAVLGAVPATLH
jgi:hypothetical protein